LSILLTVFIAVAVTADLGVTVSMLIIKALKHFIKTYNKIMLKK